jgi:hypothetical protein
MEGIPAGAFALLIGMLTGFRQLKNRAAPKAGNPKRVGFLQERRLSNLAEKPSAKAF